MDFRVIKRDNYFIPQKLVPTFLWFFRYRWKNFTELNVYGTTAYSETKIFYSLDKAKDFVDNERNELMPKPKVEDEVLYETSTVNKIDHYQIF